MMKGRKTHLILLLCAVSLLLNGCGIFGKQIFFSNAKPFCAMQIGSLACPKNEAMLYLANYENLFGTVGKTDLLKGDFSQKEFTAECKRKVISHLARVYSLNLYAKEEGITLTKAEEKKVKEAAAKYTKSLDKNEKKALDVDSESIEAMALRYALAEKVYASLMSTVDGEVSDDEARVMDAYILYTTDDKAVRTVRKKIAAGEDFHALCAKYSEDKTSETYFGRGEYPKKVEKSAFRLENGEISPCIETEKGYYFIECIDKYDEKRSEKNKKRIISERKENALLDIVTEQNKTSYSYLNEHFWKKLNIEQMDDIRTHTFFKKIDKALKK